MELVRLWEQEPPENAAEEFPSNTRGKWCHGNQPFVAGGPLYNRIEG